MNKLNAVLIVLNLLVTVGLVCAISAYYFSPLEARLPVLAGFFFPLFAVAQFLFLGCWFFRKRKWMVLPVLGILVGWPQWSATVQLNLLDGNRPDSVKEIKIATYNSKRFLVTAYKPERQIAKFNKNAGFLKGKSFDIFCLQESFTNNKFLLKKVKQLTDLNYHYSVPYGNAILSRYPIVNTFTDPADTRLNPFIYVDIQIGKDTIRVYNVHLQSLHFGENEYDLLKNPTPQQKSETRSLLRKVLSASKKRVPQVQRVLQSIKESPYPVILCGDFNDPPTSYTYHQMTKELNDSFVEKGCGIDATFAGPIPGLRIDYIMADERFRIVNHQVLQGGVSDHYPVISEMVINQ